MEDLKNRMVIYKSKLSTKNAVVDDDNFSIFLDTRFKQVKAKRSRNLALDIIQNGFVCGNITILGGNSMQTFTFKLFVNKLNFYNQTERIELVMINENKIYQDDVLVGELTSKTKPKEILDIKGNIVEHKFDTNKFDKEDSERLLNLCYSKFTKTEVNYPPTLKR